MTGQADEARGDLTADGRRPGQGPTPMRGVWVAIAIVAGAALVFLLLALTSGALNG